ncbi:uncharacterized protein [Narcine bancroftii]|uniref:uncharacterized protein isoform X2 n=1 Tax=Narcine bancroftii TaxID=1343680 RepID=UPI00383165C4
MAAAWRSGAVLKECWSRYLAQSTGTASCRLLPISGRMDTAMPSHSVKPIHCNCSSRPTLQAEEPPGGPFSQRPAYIPQRKAKNPMGKIGLAWLIGLPSGIIAFLLAKREVDKNRLKQLKVRQKMKTANEGTYQSDRYRREMEEHECSAVSGPK